MEVDLNFSGRNYHGSDAIEGVTSKAAQRVRKQKLIEVVAMLILAPLLPELGLP